MNKDFTFPGDYYSFQNGVNISDVGTNRWIDECIEKVKGKFASNPEIKEAFACISSGNTKVLCEGYKQGNGKYTVFISVIKGYYQLSECDVEF